MAIYIHPSADVAPEAKIGDNTKIWHLVQIRPGAQIGDECILGRGVYIDAQVVIGNRVKIQNYVSVYDGVTIKDGVFVGPQVVFTNDKNPRAVTPDGKLKGNDEWEISLTFIGEGSSLGANSTIVCGVTIGPWAMVGAGSVITKDVPAYGLVIGNPARLVGYVCKCGQRIPAEAESAPEQYQCTCSQHDRKQS